MEPKHKSQTQPQVLNPAFSLLSDTGLQEDVYHLSRGRPQRLIWFSLGLRYQILVSFRYTWTLDVLPSLGYVL